MKILSYFKPSAVIRDVSALDPKWLQKNNVKAVAFDLDRTLLGHNDTLLPEVSVLCLKKLSNAGLKLALITNVRTAKRNKRFNIIVDQLKNQVGTGTVISVLPADVNRKTKPHPAMFIHAAKKLNLDPQVIYYVGDQIYKDIYGPLHAGYGGAILVAPVGKDDNFVVRYFQRPTIDLLARLYYKLPLRKSSYPAELPTL